MPRSNHTSPLSPPELLGCVDHSLAAGTLSFCERNHRLPSKWFCVAEEGVSACQLWQAGIAACSELRRPELRSGHGRGASRGVRDRRRGDVRQKWICLDVSSWSIVCRFRSRVGFAAGLCLPTFAPCHCSAIGRYGPASLRTQRPE